MKVKIKNISDGNVVIKDKIIYPKKSISIDKEYLDDIEHLIGTYLEIEYTSTVITTTENFNKDEFLRIKDRLIPALFAHYLQNEVSTSELEELKWFYKNIGPTSGLSDDLKNMLNNAKNVEELTEILLNHLYPELIKSYLT